jgi:hypothetical protein
MLAARRPRQGRSRDLASSVRVALLCVASLSACSTEPQEPAGAATPAAAGQAQDGQGRAIAVQCQSGEAIDAAVRAAVEEQARAFYGALREGRTDALWDGLHPQARREDQRQPFMAALEGMEARLSGITREPRLEAVHLVDLRGGTNALARVQCGAADDPQRFTLLVNAGDEDVALAVLHTPKAAGQTEHAVTVQLRRRGERWHLLGIQVNPTAYRGQGATAYESLADLAMSQKKVVLAYLMLGLAQTLSERGASITSAAHERIESKLAAIASDRLFMAELGTWSLGDARFRIEGLSLVATQSDISPVIKYVSPQGLVEDLLDRDADALVAEVRRRFPELVAHFDAIVFEAYAEPPTEPGKSYQAFRVVRPLAPVASPTPGATESPSPTPGATESPT